ncbi:MAG: trigger factor [Chloroflexi bacterium]|nr:trigger factor [Chloroflexota bacterium]
MKIESEIQQDHQIKLSVEVEPTVLEESKRKAARRIAQRVRIPGFRPGKAPYNVIQKQVGEAAILEDAIDVLLEDVYPKILEEAGVSPYGPGSLQNIASMDPPTFEFLIPLEPAVELGDYRQIRIPFSEMEVTQEAIDSILDTLREQQATLEPVERPIEEGDLVYISLKAEGKDEPDEAKKTLIAERRYPIIIDKQDADVSEEWPFPGFARGLIGLDVGQDKASEYIFPEDSDIEELRGIAGIYSARVEEIKARNLPALDDDFAKSISEHDTLDALITEIRESLAAELKTTNRAQHENSILDRAVEEASIKYPPQMLEHELEHMVEDFALQLSRQGLGLEIYLKSRELDPAGLKEEMRPDAAKRIERSMVLMEISRQENIQVPEEVVKARLEETITEIKEVFSTENARRLTSAQSLENLAERIANEEVIRLTLQRLSQIGRGEADSIEVVSVKTTSPEEPQG